MRCAGETIPIRLFLGGFELTPTFRDVNKKFSTRYYLNLVLIDEENRRYFKSVSRSPRSVRESMPTDDYNDAQTTGDYGVPTGYARNRSDESAERVGTEAG